MTDLAFRPLVSREALISEAAQQIASHLKEDVSINGKASMFLSGGSTPGPVYSALSMESLPWDKVTIGLVDERWVDEDDTGSNAALVKRTLLIGPAKKAHFVPMKTEHRSPELGQKTVESAYKRILRPNSMAVLGMGIDGHICSWFPEAEGLAQALSLNCNAVVQAIKAKPSTTTGKYLDRMTLTYSAIKTCKSVLLLITGDEKRAVLERAFELRKSHLPVAKLIGLDQSRLTILYAP